MNDNGTTVPDIIGTVRGYRSWRLHYGHLTAVFQPYIWTSGVNTSMCEYNLRHHSHPGCTIPASCTCGFYSLYVPENHPGRINGVVENHGAISLHTDGMRAEKSRVVALCVRDRAQREALREHYPDVQLFRLRAHMYRKFPPAKEVCGVKIPQHRVRRGLLPSALGLLFGWFWIIFLNTTVSSPSWTMAIPVALLTVMTAFVLSVFA